MMPGHAWRLFGLLGVVALAAFWLALSVGSVAVTPGQWWALLAGHEAGLARSIVFELRLPRALAALATGGLLALAGCLMQVLLRNPLADPYVLGVSGGAATGALLALWLGLAGWAVSIGSLAGAVAATTLVFGLAWRRGRGDASRLLLTGVVLASGWGAMIAFLLALAPDAQLRGMTFWLMGDLAQAFSPWPALLALGLGLPLALMQGRALNLLARGEWQAEALGVDVMALRRKVYVLASVLTALAVTTAGSIGFVGLLVPHLMRLAGVHDHRMLLPAAVLGGGTLLLLADTLARTVLAPQQLPVGVLMAFLGVPLFLWQLTRSAGGRP